MSALRSAIAVLAVAIGTATVSAQVKEPPRPEKVDVQIRYRIRADRDERVRQFRALEANLAALGFVDARKDDPDRDLDILDPNAELFRGSIPSAKVLDILKDPRVQSIMFAPAEFKYPDAGDKAVAVRITLRSGLIPTAQALLHTQALAQLELLGFTNALGYDTRGYTQLKGTIPYRNLQLLLKDLRTEPAGWFLADTPPDMLPSPFADRNPARWVEVMSTADVPPPVAPAPVLPARARLTPDLRAVLDNPALKETPLRVEVLFEQPMELMVEPLRTRLTGAYFPTPRKNADGTPVKGPGGIPVITEGASLEGIAGNVATIRFDRPADVERYAFEPGVLSVRLPRQSVETVSPRAPAGKSLPAEELLGLSRVSSLHRLGYTGAGVKVILIGTDFSGAEALVGTSLPKKTRLLDLTTELNPEIRPLPADPMRAGTGLAAARALALTAPDVELVLVRVDPGSFFQLPRIIQVVNGDRGYSNAMRSRLDDLSIRSSEVIKRKDAALQEYRQAFDDLSDEPPARDRRAAARAALDMVIAEQKDLSARLERFNAYQREMLAVLAGAQVIVNTLVWESGYPLDALSELSKILEHQAVLPPPSRIVKAASVPRPKLVWVQAASASGSSVWGGQFLDPNRNGTMEFTSLDQPLPPGNWSHELNFLGMHPTAGPIVDQLPAGMQMRFTMQWREPLGPGGPGGDRPVYAVKLRVYRQIDPTGEQRPSDEMAEDAVSSGGPYAIFRGDTFTVYEQMLDFAVPAAGRYAFVVGTGYESNPVLPALRRDFEILPRVFVETLSNKPGEGKVVFRSYVTPHVGVAIPGDSPGAVTIGVPRAGELTGGGTGLTLVQKPDLLGPDSLPDVPGLTGTGIAAGFVGGIAADLVQAGAAGANVFRSSGVEPGKSIVLPNIWLRYLRPAGSR
jgi:hypothetical protein